jgi:hypothetical protein
MWNFKRWPTVSLLSPGLQLQKVEGMFFLCRSLSDSLDWGVWSMAGMPCVADILLSAGLSGSRGSNPSLPLCMNLSEKNALGIHGRGSGLSLFLTIEKTERTHFHQFLGLAVSSEPLG